jgi:CheY-like chemotaxis protein
METDCSTRLRVLIADDVRDTLMTVGIILRSEGFDVRLAERGTEVPTTVEEFQPHAVLLDITRLDGNRLELARELKRRYGTRCPVLIAITGKNNDDTKSLAALSGFSHFISKPCDPDALLGLVASIRPVN